MRLQGEVSEKVMVFAFRTSSHVACIQSIQGIADAAVTGSKRDSARCQIGITLFRYKTTVRYQDQYQNCTIDISVVTAALIRHA